MLDQSYVAFGTPVIVTDLWIAGSTQTRRAARLVLLGGGTAAVSLGRRAIYLGLAAEGPRRGQTPPPARMRGWSFIH
jgi:hypothetical protein